MNIDSANKIYKNIDGVIYMDEGKTLFLYPANHPLKLFKVPDNVTKIETGAFAYCQNLENIVLPESLKEIGDYAFNSCKSLKSISIPKSVTNIGNGAFSHSEKLESIALPEDLKEIGKGTFAFCRNLETIALPGELKKIGEKAFQACKSLKSISIPANVTSIGKGVFYACNNLEKVNIDSANKVYKNVGGVIYTDAGKTLFLFPAKYYIQSFIVPDNVTKIGDYAFSRCVSIESIILPGGLKEIGDYAFSTCKSLKSISIPASVTSIGKTIFYECSNLEAVNVDSANKIYKSIDGVIYTDEGKTLFLYPINHHLKSFAVPSSVTKIGDYAFSRCVSLENIALPGGLKEIGKEAFYSCKSLKSVSIPSSVTSIGVWAFDSENIETITFKEAHEWYATEVIFDDGTFSPQDSGEKVKTVTLSTIDFSQDNDFNKYYWHRDD